MSKRNRNKGNKPNTGIAAGAPPQPAPSAAVGNAAATPGGNPPTITRNGWIILGILAVGLVAAFFYFTRDNEPPATPSDGKTVNVVMETSMGVVKIELYPNKAPITVDNFLKYVDERHYDGTIFHRVISGFMIQGGGMGPDMKERPGRSPIKNEAGNGLRNDRGTVAMARTKAPDSATAQFFINVVDNEFLNRANAMDKVGYAVFGKVTDGMDVVDQIRRVATNGEAGGNVPLQPVFIKSIRRLEN
jgi:cyclophilin family peptidyl-prolyl cis-trans isomerase